MEKQRFATVTGIQMEIVTIQYTDTDEIAKLPLSIMPDGVKEGDRILVWFEIKIIKIIKAR
jgi:hypothetical protein